MDPGEPPSGRIGIVPLAGFLSGSRLVRKELVPGTREEPRHLGLPPRVLDGPAPLPFPALQGEPRGTATPGQRRRIEEAREEPPEDAVRPLRDLGAGDP